jgi:hypothetical protein
METQMKKGKVIINERGTTIIKLETGARWFNPDAPLQHCINYDNGTVWVNAPLSLSIDEFESMEELEVSFYVNWTHEYQDRLIQESNKNSKIVFTFPVNEEINSKFKE